uniref:SET domain-containing protein n=2 Tax=Dunaliella tertiolecta TaxID=3047 RepID=A0A7S3R5E5_DUNTE
MRLPGHQHVSALPRHQKLCLHVRRQRLPSCLPCLPAKALQKSQASTSGGNVTDGLGRWLQTCGGQLEGASFDGRELRAAQDLEERSLLVAVPEVGQLRYDLIKDPKLLKLFDKLPKASNGGNAPAWQFKQALAVLWHLSRGESSPLHTPLHALPGLAPGVPVPCVGMYFQDELLPELQDEILIKSTLNHRYWWHEVWAKELETLAGTDDDPFQRMQITREMFGWAVAVSLSRCFGLKSVDSHVMTPVIDMLNHSFESNCAIESNSKGICMMTKHKVQKGTPLTLTYGPHSNAQQLLSYGFVTGDNPHNIFSLTFDVALFTEIINQFGGDVPVPLATWQLQALEKLGIDQTSPAPAANELSGPLSDDPSSAATESRLFSPEMMYLKAHGMPPVDPRLLAGLRVMLLAEDERYMLQLTSPDTWGRWGAPLSKLNEVKVLKALSAIITAFYKGFPSTIQEDKRLLAGLQELLSKQTTPISASSPFQPPSNIDCYELALRYRLAMKQSLEKSLINVRARMKDLGA